MRYHQDTACLHRTSTGSENERDGHTDVQPQRLQKCLFADNPNGQDEMPSRVMGNTPLGLMFAQSSPCSIELLFVFAMMHPRAAPTPKDRRKLSPRMETETLRRASGVLYHCILSPALLIYETLHSVSHPSNKTATSSQQFPNQAAKQSPKPQRSFQNCIADLCFLHGSFPFLVCFHHCNLWCPALLTFLNCPVKPIFSVLRPLSQPAGLLAGPPAGQP